MDIITKLQRRKEKGESLLGLAQPRFLGRAPKNGAGFTFVEIIVVLGIFAVISSVVIFNFRDFSSGVSLQNLTQLIALQASSMQRSALAGKQPFSLTPQGSPPPTVIPAPGKESWTPGYGICFTLDKTGCGLASGYGPDNQITGFTLFADSQNDGKFFPNEKLDIVGITGGDFISDICLNQQTGTNPQLCGLTNSGARSVSVAYTRPEVSPRIFYGTNFSSVASDVTITVKSTEGATREIIIWVSGQIETR